MSVKSMLFLNFSLNLSFNTSLIHQCCWQLYDVCDSFGHFCHRHPLSYYISVGHQHSAPTLSPILSRQHHCRYHGDLKVTWSDLKRCLLIEPVWWSTIGIDFYWLDVWDHLSEMCGILTLLHSSSSRTKFMFSD